MLPRWCAPGDEGAREARGVGRLAGRPEAPAGGAGGLPTRLVDALVIHRNDAPQGAIIR